VEYSFAIATPDIDLSPDPVIEAYKRDVDRSLIRENLKLSVEQTRHVLCAPVARHFGEG